ncbi:MAG TPA: hypothetical protein VFZ66_02560 [Herpetosiphonaceae bacterium]
MEAIHAVPDTPSVTGMPEWITPSLHVTAGRDPIGLQTITIDRIIPQLLPGVLALSRRARYLSIYAFLLDEYRAQRLPASKSALSDFLRAREYEYALAVQLCPRGCGSLATAVVGKQVAGPAARRTGDALPRGTSVESFLGGYGLYYRTPMIDLGLVVPAGSLLGDTPTPIDVLADEGMHPHAAALAAAFRETLAGTAYYREHMRGIGPIPRAALVELAEHACLCRLADAPAERALLHTVLFAPTDQQDRARVEQRRRSFALLLSLVADDPLVAVSDDAFRAAIWERFITPAPRSDAHATTLAQWAALVAKEYLQEGISTIWTAFCHMGLARQPADGLAPDELDHLLRADLVGSSALDLFGTTIRYTPTLPTAECAAAVIGAVADVPLEQIRRHTNALGHAVAGLALLLALVDRLPHVATAPRAWQHIGSQRSEHQPGLLGFTRQLAEHRAADPTLGDTIAWLVRRYVLRPHEQIAYSKLPDRTFRFRWEQGRLRFYDLSAERFGLTDIRRDAMTWIGEDLGLLTRNDGSGHLTAQGQQFVAEVLG